MMKRLAVLSVAVIAALNIISVASLGAGSPTRQPRWGAVAQGAQ